MYSRMHVIEFYEQLKWNTIICWLYSCASIAIDTVCVTIELQCIAFFVHIFLFRFTCRIIDTVCVFLIIIIQVCIMAMPHDPLNFERSLEIFCSCLIKRTVIGSEKYFCFGIKVASETKWNITMQSYTVQFGTVIFALSFAPCWAFISLNYVQISIF